MKLLIATLVAVTTLAHQSFNGGEGFAPHWETPAWRNDDSPGQDLLNKLSGDDNRREFDENLHGAEQDDNFMNKDDDRRVYAPAYDDHQSYAHHPTAHKYSDEHLQDDEGQSTRVIHGQDTSQHVNRRTKKKVFDTIKEPKHHFAVQSIDVPFPFHHHYYNHTKVHYHDGYDLYDDDVGDSEKYYHVNPDTHTNVDGWFADDHYRVSNEAFTDDGATADDGFIAVRREGTGDFRRSADGTIGGRVPVSRRASGAYDSLVAIGGLDADDGADRRPEAIRFRNFATDRLAEWRMRNTNYYKGAGAVKWRNTGTGSKNMGSRGMGYGKTRQSQGLTALQGASTSPSKNNWLPFSSVVQSRWNGADGRLTAISKSIATDPGTARGQGKSVIVNRQKGVPRDAMMFSDRPLVGAGTIGSLGGRTMTRRGQVLMAIENMMPGAILTGGGSTSGPGYKKTSTTMTGKGFAAQGFNSDPDRLPYTGGRYGDRPAFPGGKKNRSAVKNGGMLAQVEDDFGRRAITNEDDSRQGGMDKSSWGQGFAQTTGTEGTNVGGALSNFKYNWDNIDDSQYPRGIRENTIGADDSEEVMTQAANEFEAAQNAVTNSDTTNPAMTGFAAAFDTAQEFADAIVAALGDFWPTRR